MTPRLYKYQGKDLTIKKIAELNNLARNSVGVRIKKAEVKPGGDVTNIFLATKFSGQGIGERNAMKYALDGTLMSIKDIAIELGFSHSDVWLSIRKSGIAAGADIKKLFERR